MSRTDELNVEQVKKQVPGGEADKPTEIPAKGWLQVVKRGWAEAKADQVPLLAAGVAFYAFLALFPSLIATVLIYGLVVRRSRSPSRSVSSPPGCRRTPASSSPTRSPWRRPSRPVRASAAVLAILLALWAASGGMGNLMTAISTAYDEEEKRSFIKKRALALVLTVGADRLPDRACWAWSRCSRCSPT